MPDLSFAIDGVEAVQSTASPLVALKLRISNGNSTETIHTGVLRCQAQIETARRRYSTAEQDRLSDLFGAPERWAQTLRPLLWANTHVIVPSFTADTLVEVQLPCSFDFNIASTKYFAGLEDGDIAVTLLFSGTIFYKTSGAPLQIAQVPWDKEAGCRVPVRLWREIIDACYPNSAWISLRRDVFDRLYEYKIRRGIPTWEDTFEHLLAEYENRLSKSA